MFKQYDPTQRSRNAYLQIDIINGRNNRVISSRLLSSTAHGWITFPLTKIVSRWVRKPHKNNGIRINVKRLYKAKVGKQLEETLQFGTKNSFRREPMLVVFSKRTKGSNLASLLNEGELTAMKEKLTRKERMRRAIAVDETFTNLTDEPGKRNTRKDVVCHLRSLNVSVARFGFKMKLIYPSVFSVNQCVGTCKFKQLHDGKFQTNHALFQAYRAAEEGLGKRTENHVEPPCCAPSEYESQLVFFRNLNREVTILHLEKVKATKCQCL